MSASVLSVCASASHTFSKPVVPSIRLIQGIGVAGDTHAGALVQHTYLVGKDETQPNLRKVHLIHAELFDQLAAHGHQVRPGELGENVTTTGVDLLDLPTGARLQLGLDAVVEVTGLRNPCVQIEQFQTGLLRQLRFKDTDGSIRRIGGVMGVVVAGGIVAAGDTIEIDLPSPPYVSLRYVADSHKPAHPLRSQ